MKTLGPDSKTRVDEDLKTENEFFDLVTGKIPKRKSADPAFMRSKHDVLRLCLKSWTIVPMI